jgi:hypothetical protein
MTVDVLLPSVSFFLDAILEARADTPPDEAALLFKTAGAFGLTSSWASTFQTTSSQPCKTKADRSFVERLARAALRKGAWDACARVCLAYLAFTGSTATWRVTAAETLRSTAFLFKTLRIKLRSSWMNGNSFAPFAHAAADDDNNNNNNNNNNDDDDDDDDDDESLYGFNEAAAAVQRALERRRASRRDSRRARRHRRAHRKLLERKRLVDSSNVVIE